MATTHRRLGQRAGVVATCLWLSGAAVAAQPPPLDPIVLVRVPDAGLQPAAEVDDAGRVHLIYFRGAPSGGDVFYVSRPPTSEFSTPVRVNSQPGSVIATGTVRGAHLSLGADGRPHVAWMGSNTAEPRGPEPDALYTPGRRRTVRATAKPGDPSLRTGRRRDHCRRPAGPVDVWRPDVSGCPAGGGMRRRRVVVPRVRESSVRFGFGRR